MTRFNWSPVSSWDVEGVGSISSLTSPAKSRSRRMIIIRRRFLGRGSSARAPLPGKLPCWFVFGDGVVGKAARVLAGAGGVYHRRAHAIDATKNEKKDTDKQTGGSAGVILTPGLSPRSRIFLPQHVSASGSSTVSNKLMWAPAPSS